MKIKIFKFFLKKLLTYPLGGIIKTRNRGKPQKTNKKDKFRGKENERIKKINEMYKNGNVVEVSSQ